MLLTNTIDSIVLATKKTDNSMYALSHVRITETEMQATNGASLYWSPTKTYQSLDEYPSNDGSPFTPIPFYPVLIPGKAITKAINNRPKKGMSLLTDNIVVQTTPPPDGLGKTQIELTTTDLDTFDCVTCKTDSTEYPDIDRLRESIPRDEDVNTVNLGVLELELLLKIAKKAKVDSVLISVKDATTMIGVEVGPISGLIMPYCE